MDKITLSFFAAEFVIFGKMEKINDIRQNERRCY